MAKYGLVLLLAVLAIALWGILDDSTEPLPPPRSADESEPTPAAPPANATEHSPPSPSAPDDVPEEPPEKPPLGRVVDHAGLPVEGAVVTYDWMTAARFLWPVPGRPGVLPTTDRRGHFRWAGKPPTGIKRWFAVHRDHGIGSTAVGSEGDPPMEIRLRPALRVDVEVFEPDGARPEKLEVSLHSKKRDLWAPSADLPRAHVPEHIRIEGPSLALPGLSGHPFVVWIRAAGYRPRKLEAGDFLPGPGMRHRKVEVILQEGSTISGRVRDADGKPVVNATVHVNDGGRPRYRTEPFWCLHGRTDEKGRFSVGGLADGTFQIRVHARDAKTSAVVATGIRAGTTGLELKLPE